VQSKYAIFSTTLYVCEENTFWCYLLHMTLAVEENTKVAWTYWGITETIVVRENVSVYDGALLLPPAVQTQGDMW